jgi:hypothetical protein
VEFLSSMIAVLREPLLSMLEAYEPEEYQLLGG